MSNDLDWWIGDCRAWASFRVTWARATESVWQNRRPHGAGHCPRKIRQRQLQGSRVVHQSGHRRSGRRGGTILFKPISCWPLFTATLSSADRRTFRTNARQHRKMSCVSRRSPLTVRAKRVKDIGFVYVLSNPAMPGVVKVGFTTRVPNERLIELSDASGVPVPFVLEYWCFTEQPSAVEKKVHDGLDTWRVSASREFFGVSVAHAIEAVAMYSEVAPSNYQRVSCEHEQNSRLPEPVICPYCGAQNMARTCKKCGGGW